ncbi:MAG: glycosyltransferase family 4 protein [Elusimicrobiota bacterium]|jgi:glycosyltransferase involved in cell wall biosynthesis
MPWTSSKIHRDETPLPAPHPPLKVLYLCVGLNGLGGTANHLRTLLGKIDPDCIEATLVIGTKIPDVLKTYFRDTPARIIIDGRYKRCGYLPFIGSLAALCRQKRFDLVHSFFIQSDVIAALLAAGGLFRSRISTFEGRLITSVTPWKIGLLNVLNRLIRKGFDCNVFISQYLLKTYGPRHGLTGKRACVIYPGIDASWFKDAPPPREHPETFRVGFVGRWSPEKGSSIFLDAAVFMTHRLLPIRLFILGAARSDPRLQTEIRRRGLETAVAIRPWEEDLRPALKELDIVVIPSLEEGLSYVAIEALSQKRAVIASDVGGLPEVVRSGRTGKLIPPGDPAALAAAVEECLREWGSARRLGEEGFVDCRERFEAGREASEIAQLYENVLKSAAV